MLAEADGQARKGLWTQLSRSAAERLQVTLFAIFCTRPSYPRGWETNVVLLGVHLAQLLTVLLPAACVLLGLLALVAPLV